MVDQGVDARALQGYIRRERRHRGGDIDMFMEDREMIRENQAVRVFLPAILVALCLVAGCAAVQDVRVTYSIPDPVSALDGRKVFIEFEDVRKQKEILGPGAQEAYTYHSGNVALFLSKSGEDPYPAGLKDVPSLLRDVFSLRIRQLGGDVVTRKSEAEAVLRIVLKTFSLDLKDRTWVGRMAYGLQVHRGDRLRARQAVSGEAERVKIYGLKQADQVMGELFTDLVNRPDMPKLFQEAGL